MSGTFDQDTPVWEIPIINFIVGSIQLGGDLRLLASGSARHGVSPQHSTTITLAAFFFLETSDGTQYELDGGGGWDQLIPILNLRLALITGAIAHEERHKVLSLTFDSGATLTAPPHHEGFEAWGVVGPGDFNLFN